MESSEYSVVISQWMKTVMAQKRISANQWASMAGTSATNITRFLNSNCGFIPSAKTIAKLAAIAGSSPDFTSTTSSEKRGFQIPIFNLDLEEFGTILCEHENLAAYQLGEWTGMGARGIMSHSIVFVEPKNKFSECSNGDIVLYKSHSAKLMCAEYAGGILASYPSHASLEPEDGKPPFKQAFWAPLKTSVIGNARLIGKVHSTLLRFS